MPRLLVALGLLAFVPVACADISVFDEGGASDDEGDATTVGSGASSAGGNSAGGGGLGGSVTVGPTTATATSTTGTTTSVATTSTTTATSTSTGDPGVSIPCGGQTTCTGTEVCCVHYQDASLDECAAPGACGSGFVEVGCNGPMDCTGNEVCCGLWNQQTGYQQIACMPSCNGGGGYIGFTMCGDDPTVCEAWEDCDESNFLPEGHSLCQ